mmetsp:Transcript_1323/g.3199  ORF Transcript_1323/g.3199 Transcript_1323/m.3199 type:complete len:202 (+) Transcript_1323:342-947(+)
MMPVAPRFSQPHRYTPSLPNTRPRPSCLAPASTPSLSRTYPTETRARSQGITTSRRGTASTARLPLELSPCITFASRRTARTRPLSSPSNSTGEERNRASISTPVPPPDFAAAAFSRTSKLRRCLLLALSASLSASSSIASTKRTLDVASKPTNSLSSFAVNAMLAALRLPTNVTRLAALPTSADKACSATSVVERMSLAS